MKTQETGKDISKVSSRAKPWKIGDLKELVELCRENKITQLKLPDGTSILMSDYAFHGVFSGEKAPSQGDFPTTSDLESDNLDEDVLFASAR